MKINIKNLKILRDYLESGEWKKYGKFDMLYFWSYRRSCGCLMGHAVKGKLFPDVEGRFKNWFGMTDCKTEEFIFSGNWAYYDNTPEGAIGRIDAVIGGLRF